MHASCFPRIVVKSLCLQTMHTQNAKEEERHQQHKNKNKAQIVGWLPVCSCKKKINKTTSNGSDCVKLYVKVSQDDAPILCKIDMYADLVVRFEELFGYFAVEGGVLRDYSDTD
ncbi:hypothetical protein Sjap_004143 [Stephania japonica]|uniref:Auxin-responsive protein n=1 Tax=Stephania japonica TaxID=461633 RepID=A0AAP0K3Y9_9MAGN